MKKGSKRTLRLQNWIINNYEDWCTICGTGKSPISEQEFMRLGEALTNIGFEEITLVLLQCHYYAVQDRAEKKMKVIAELYEDELKKGGLDPEEILRTLSEN